MCNWKVKSSLSYAVQCACVVFVGAGVFVTAVVAGTIAIIHPFDAMQRPFIRDIVFYLAGVFWTFSVMWDKKITKIEAIGKDQKELSIK